MKFIVNFIKKFNDYVDNRTGWKDWENDSILDPNDPILEWFKEKEK